jgi:DNA-binding NtrC family response regulator
MEQILITDDDRAFRVATRTLLNDAGFGVSLASDGSEAMATLRQGSIDLLLTDLRMGEMNGIELLRRVRVEWPGLPVIMVTGFASVDTAVEAMKLGAVDYLTKPSNNAELLLKVTRALEAGRRDRELRALREEVGRIYSFANIVSRSSAMREVLRLIRQVADTDATVLITGESGTGKELVARALHFNSGHKGAPFVAVNCSAIPDNLLESELFGYEKGAFTGALKRRPGRFEEAGEGTLFLDEIGDLAPAVQTKLLRVLQERTFSRVGGNEQIAATCRVVAATNRDLSLMMHQGEFREDLFYRLNVFPIALPPLRDRLEDIPLLARHLLERHAALANGRVRDIAPEALSSMMNYHWRGNVRELENLITRAIIKCEGDVIRRVDLPVPQERHPAALPEAPGQAVPVSYKEYLSAVVREAEEKYLVGMLRLRKGNVNQVAREMDIDRKTVYRKLTEYSIDPGQFRE